MANNKPEKIKTAIALEYDPEKEAPVVIASGRGELAERIIEKAPCRGFFRCAYQYFSRSSSASKQGCPEVELCAKTVLLPPCSSVETARSHCPH